jgi:folate-dependent phosphoribosylglycinamide formyltransferase PurN
MKKLYLFRSSFEAKYILSKLNLNKISDRVIIETGEIAKSKKLKNIFHKKNILNYPKLFLDLASLLLYSKYIENGVKRQLKNTFTTCFETNLVVKDANDDECIEYVKSYKPDIIFIYGTAILSKEFIKNVKTTIINIHTGILPFYRNVHSDFWAYLKKDYKNIGVTLIYLDTGVDSGDICSQKRIILTPSDNLISIKIKNIIIIPGLIKDVINKFKHNTMQRVKQDVSLVGFYRTPSFKDLFTLLAKRY